MRNLITPLLATAAVSIFSTASTYGQPGWILSHQKISNTHGDCPPLDDYDSFGISVAWLGDLDGDGVDDLAVGVVGDDDGGPGRGAVWILFLNADGTVKSDQKISETQGGFTGALANSDFFGYDVAALGDLDGDGVGDLVVGAAGDGTPTEPSRGAVWVLFLDGVAACPARLLLPRSRFSPHPVEVDFSSREQQ